MPLRILNTSPVKQQLAPYSGGTYAVVDSLHYRGGFKSVSGLTERNNITEDRRTLGMMVHDVDEDNDKYWVLIFNRPGPVTENVDWEEFAAGTSGADYNHWDVQVNDITPKGIYKSETANDYNLLQLTGGTGIDLIGEDVGGHTYKITINSDGVGLSNFCDFIRKIFFFLTASIDLYFSHIFFS
jgi:hypothetical protein